MSNVFYCFYYDNSLLNLYYCIYDPCYNKTDQISLNPSHQTRDVDQINVDATSKTGPTLKQYWVDFLCLVRYTRIK